MEFLNWINKDNIKHIKDPSTIEEYQKAQPAQKFLWTIKWATETYQDLNGNDVCKEKLYFFESKKLKCIKYKLYKINLDMYSKEYDSIEEMLRDNNIKLIEYQYIKRYYNKKLKNPKYNIFGKIKFIEIYYKLEGNKYKKVDEKWY